MPAKSPYVIAVSIPPDLRDLCDALARTQSRAAWIVAAMRLAKAIEDKGGSVADTTRAWIETG